MQQNCVELVQHRGRLLGVTKGRMTHDELEGLLALEAKGAARSLRSDPSELVPDPEDRPSTSLLLLDRVSDLPLEPVFLDAPQSDRYPTSERKSDRPEALRTELAPQTTRSRARRGRIDLAALLYEFATQYGWSKGRFAIEPGSGTEVVGNEEDLRRVLQLMVLQSPGSASEASEAQHNVEVRREGDWIRVSVDLGPDISLIHDAERRWLHRVAIRHGGRFELRGNSQCLLLPADASAHAEVLALQRELEQAQALGETYARELATVIANDSSKAQTEAGPLSLLAALGAVEPLLQLCFRELSSSNPNAEALAPLRNVLLLLGAPTDTLVGGGTNTELAAKVARAVARLKAQSGASWPKQND
jgi:hypothetical protein